MKKSALLSRKTEGAVVDVCHRLYEKGLVSAYDGNVTARAGNDLILATPSGVNKGMISPADLVRLKGDGKWTTGHPSTEIGMHLFIYRRRPDIHAVVHAHPPFATSFAAAGIALDQPILPEVIVGLGNIPLARYATPSTDEVARSIAPFVANHTAILLSNHGVVTFGSDPLDAYFKMEKVEHAAKTIFYATMLGGARKLKPSDLRNLARISAESSGDQLRIRELRRLMA
jgi:L-fuculose-phosphate aldolase